MNKFNSVVVVGLGYIGLPTATVLAKCGIQVVGVDLNPAVVETINSGKIHIVEPDLDGLVHHMVTSGRLVAKFHPEPADVFIIAVPTPFTDGHKPDLSFIESATQSIAPHVRRGNLVILESTSPVGTTEQVSKWLAESRPDLTFPHQSGEDADVQLAYCPERVLPGQVLRELVQNDRVIGGMTANAATKAESLYRLFVKGECFISDDRMAEMCKLTENAFRDLNIAFANELSMICDELKLNAWKLIKLANRHPRVNILEPGPGVGGHCIAVDPWFIVDSVPDRARLIRTAREVNDTKPKMVLEKIRRAVDSCSDPVICCLGLSFKANIDDLRESPAVEIVHSLILDQVSTVFVVEPHIDALPERLRIDKRVKLETIDDALRRANIVVILVKHKIFSGITPAQLQDKIVVDACGLFEGGA